LLLLLLVLGFSVQGAAQPNADGAARLEAAPRAQGLTESARACRALHDEALRGEVSALEPETDNEPVAPELPCVIKPVFGGTAKLTPTGQVLRAATGTHTVRFAASPVLARAPPHSAR
jgi:hypothetical protein